MSQLTEIIENHESMDQLVSILKHHGVSTEFVTSALLESFEGTGEEQGEEKERVDLIVGDLKQFSMRF